MSAFMVGEIVVGRNFVRQTQRNGAECEIIGPLQLRRLVYADAPSESVMAYRVRWANGDIESQPPIRLRKRRPPSTDESESRQAMLDCIERAKRGAGVVV